MISRALSTSVCECTSSYSLASKNVPFFIPFLHCSPHVALCVHHEVHQPASSAAGCPHPQTPASCSHLDGLSAGFLPWTPGQIRSCSAKQIRSSNWSFGILLTQWMSCMFQVLKGDIRPAIETHEMLYQVTKKHNFLPEVIRFTVSDLTVRALDFEFCHKLNNQIITCVLASCQNCLGRQLLLHEALEGWKPTASENKTILIMCWVC